MGTKMGVAKSFESCTEKNSTRKTQAAANVRKFVVMLSSRDVSRATHFKCTDMMQQHFECKLCGWKTVGTSARQKL